MPAARRVGSVPQVTRMRSYRHDLFEHVVLNMQAFAQIDERRATEAALRNEFWQPGEQQAAALPPRGGGGGNAPASLRALFGTADADMQVGSSNCKHSDHLEAFPSCLARCSVLPGPVLPSGTWYQPWE